MIYILSRIILPVVLIAASACTLSAQSIAIRGVVYGTSIHEAHDDEPTHVDTIPIRGATVRVADTEKGAITNADGEFEVSGLASGTYQVQVTYLGYSEVDTALVVGPSGLTNLSIYLVEDAHEMEEVVVTATRTQRAIDDVPVRVEVVPQEEVEEKLLMAPANVSMLLNESTGMRVQTTSPTTSTANLRIQGLPGRYTQLLVDGIPNVGGLSAGFGLTELPPLNLRQVEIIKGAASALYGADAISGVVNFITKRPREQPEVSALVNVTSQKGLDLAAFYSRRIDDFGFTILASRNAQKQFDVDTDGFADVPEYERWSINPKLTYDFSPSVSADLSIGYMQDDRIGGAAVSTTVHTGTDVPYSEHVESKRMSIAGQLSWSVTDHQSALLKIAGMQLKRDAQYGSTPFIAEQQTMYADVQYSIGDLGAHELLFGAIVSMDDFTDNSSAATVFRSYTHKTYSVLAQDEVKVSDQVSFVASGRFDTHNVYGSFVTPRVSVMYRPSDQLTMRIGGGTGFKAPTMFVEEAEERGFKNVYLNPNAIAERSQSGSVDLNYRTTIGEVGVHANVVAYLTRLQDALVSDADSLATGVVYLRNATAETMARGAELALKFSYNHFKLSLGYTLLTAEQTDKLSTVELALNPRHSLGCVLMYEDHHDGLKAGLEAYYTGVQRLESHPSRTNSPSFWVAGLLIEKAFGPIRLFINAENFLDTRQTNYERIIVGDPMLGPIQTLPIYAPLEGRVFNGGIRFVM